MAIMPENLCGTVSRDIGDVVFKGVGKHWRAVMGVSGKKGRRVGCYKELVFGELVYPASPNVVEDHGFPCGSYGMDAVKPCQATYVVHGMSGKAIRVFGSDVAFMDEDHVTADPYQASKRRGERMSIFAGAMRPGLKSRARGLLAKRRAIQLPVFGAATRVVRKPKKMGSFIVTVLELRRKKSICEVDFNGVPVQATFPTDILQKIGLKKRDKFEWTVRDQRTVRPEDCRPIARERRSAEQERKIETFLRKAISEIREEE